MAKEKPGDVIGYALVIDGVKTDTIASATLAGRAAKRFGQMHRERNNPEAGYFSVAVYKVINGKQERKPLYAWAKGLQV